MDAVTTWYGMPYPAYDPKSMCSPRSSPIAEIIVAEFEATGRPSIRTFQTLFAGKMPHAGAPGTVGGGGPTRPGMVADGLAPTGRSAADTAPAPRAAAATSRNASATTGACPFDRRRRSGMGARRVGCRRRPDRDRRREERPDQRGRELPRGRAEQGRRHVAERAVRLRHWREGRWSPVGGTVVRFPGAPPGNGE